MISTIIKFIFVLIVYKNIDKYKYKPSYLVDVFC